MGAWVDGSTRPVVRFERHKPSRDRRERSQQALWQWVHRLADNVSDPSRVAIDETAIKINGDWSWVYAAIDVESKLILDVAVFRRRGTQSSRRIPAWLSEKYDISDTVFLVAGYGYLTALSRLGLSGQLDYVERNRIEK